MARNMYGATSADFTLTSGGRVIPGAVLTLWTARTGGTQITDLLDVDSVACTTVTSAADGSVVYYGPNNDKTVHWADSGQGSRVAIRPTDITGDPPVMSIGTVGTGTAAASLTGTSEAPVLNLTLPSAGANGVNTAAIQDDAVTAAKIAANAVGASELADSAVDTAAIADGAVTPAKMATTGRFTFPTGAADGYGFTSGAVNLSGTGSPEGVVTAAPGSTWLQTDATTDTKGWLRWVKASGTGNTGWVAGPEADTGWRALTPLSPSNTTISWLYIRRVGQMVAVSYRLAISDTAWKALYGVLAGFKPLGGYVSGVCPRPAGGGASDGVQWHVGADFNLNVRADNGSEMDGGFTYMAYDAWPSSLPGSAV